MAVMMATVVAIEFADTAIVVARAA